MSLEKGKSMKKAEGRRPTWTAIFNSEGLMWFLSTRFPCRWIMQAVRWQAFTLLTGLESFSRFHGVGMGKRGRNSEHHLALNMKSYTQGATQPLKLLGCQGIMLYISTESVCHDAIIPNRYYVSHPFVVFLHPWCFRNTFVNRVWPKWALSVWVWPPDLDALDMFSLSTLRYNDFI